MSREQDTAMYDQPDSFFEDDNYTDRDYYLPDIDPEAVVEDGPSTLMFDYGSEIGSYDDLDDQSFYMLEATNPFDGSTYEDWRN